MEKELKKSDLRRRKNSEASRKTSTSSLPLHPLTATVSFTASNSDLAHLALSEHSPLCLNSALSANSPLSLNSPLSANLPLSLSSPSTPLEDGQRLIRRASEVRPSKEDSKDGSKDDSPYTENAKLGLAELKEAWTSPSLHLIPIAMAEMRKSAHEFIEQIWKLQLHADLPGWRRDNDFLVANHRPVLASVTECVASIFKFHSETWNIWTHLLGFLALIVYSAILIRDNDGKLLPNHEVAILNLHTFMGALCFLFSTTFHILECHSPFIHEMFCRLDHFGIAGLIWAAKLAWIKCSSLDRDSRIDSALIQGANVVSLTSVVLQFSGFLSRPSQRSFRTVWFIGTTALFVLFPLVDLVQNHGLKDAIQVARLDLFLLSIVSILVGCVFYVSHIPERFFPGQCDIFLQGHTLLHIFVNLTIFLQVYGFRESAVNREIWRSQREKASFWG